MKKTTLIFCRLFLLCTAIFFFFNSCSKEDSGTKTETINLSTVKSSYAPYEIVTFSTSDNLITEQSFTASINNIKIIVGTNENQASFILPNLPNGNYNLSFSLNSKNYDIPVKVESISTILTADQYFNDIQASITQNINVLTSQITQLEQNSSDPNEYANLKNDVVKYTNLLNDYKASYANLSAIEKEEFAKTMAANKATVDEFNSLSSNLKSGISTLKNAQSVQDYEKGVEVSKTAFVASVVFTVAHIPAMITTAKLIASPNPWVSAGAVLATGIIFTSYCINVDETVTASQHLTSKALKPYEFLTDVTQSVYKSGLETVSNIQAKYRSLIDSDGNDSGTTINIIIEKYKYFKEKYNGLVSSLPSILRPSYVITSLKSTYKNTTRSIYNQYISITNINNSNVKLQQINNPDGSITIKATNTTTADQTFTYDVNYTNSNFSKGLTKTVSAKVLAPNPCDQGTMTAPVINSVNFECNSQNEIAILVSFTANGTGILPYGGSGACDVNDTCYPVRLYFMNPGATEYSIAANGYRAKLKSGDVNSGVVEITITNCQNGKSALESLNTNYPNYKWKVELMNQCNQRSNQVSF